MKIYREVKCSDRLPDKDGSYFIILKNGRNDKFDLFLRTDSVRYWDDVEYWLEPIEYELDSEKILPKEERGLHLIKGKEDYVYQIDLALKAIEASELQVFKLKQIVLALETMYDAISQNNTNLLKKYSLALKSIETFELNIIELQECLPNTFYVLLPFKNRLTKLVDLFNKSYLLLEKLEKDC